MDVVDVGAKSARDHAGAAGVVKERGRRGGDADEVELFLYVGCDFCGEVALPGLDVVFRGEVASEIGV